MNKKIVKIILFIVLAVAITMPVNVMAMEDDISLYEEDKSIKSIKITVHKENIQVLRYDFTDEEFDLLSHLIMGEAEGESLDGKIAVGQVILNRMSKTGKTMKDVIYEKVGGYTQFTCTTDGRFDLEPNEESIKAVESIALGETVIDDDVTYFNAGYSKWHMKNLTYVKKIDKHYFYKE